MALIWVLLGIVVLGGVAVVASGRGEGLRPAQPDRPDLSLPAGRPAGPGDVDAVRFSVGLRGYRMDEVDDVLDRVSADLAERDARIELLEQQIAQAVPEGEPPAQAGPDLGWSQAPPGEAEQPPGPAGPREGGEQPGAPDLDHPAGEPQGGEPNGGADDAEPRVSRTMIVPIATSEPTPPDGPDGG